MSAEANKSKRCRVTTDYQVYYPDAIKVSRGEELTISEKESEWAGWVWCTNKEGKSSWVPENYVTRIGDSCTAKVDYDAKELAASVGEELIFTQEESGWVWCINERGERGWVPLDNVEKI